MSGIEVPRWPTTSRELLAALPDPQNSEAWNEFDRRYGDVVRAFCLEKGLQLADAEDVTQQVFTAVSRQVGGFEYNPDRGRFRSWLVTVSLRAIWKVWKRQGRSQEITLSDLDVLLQPSDDGWLRDFSGAITEVAATRIRAEFSQEEWTVYEQSWLQEVPYVVIGRELGRSVSWVYQAKSRILKRLRQQVAILCEDIASPLPGLP